MRFVMKNSTSKKSLLLKQLILQFDIELWKLFQFVDKRQKLFTLIKLFALSSLKL